MSATFRLFLESIGLDECYEMFLAQGIETDVFADLSDDDLREIGLNIGQRKRFQRSFPQATPVRKDPVATWMPETERRQLTVVFIDLVGSTALSASRDVEDFRTIISVYQKRCAEVIDRHGGTVAKYMGDGILAYFGYPRAEEYSAERAVRAGLEIIDAVSDLRPLPDLKLACRVAAATGMVIVGDLIGEGAAQERQVVGDTPNLAARLQERAAPNQLLISESTHELVSGLYDCRSQGKTKLKGYDRPVPFYQVISELQIDSRFRAGREGRTLAPLSGRDHELQGLLSQWDSARSGHLEIALIVGEAGMGKSRLLAALQEKVIRGAHHIVDVHCHPQFANSTLNPLIGHLIRKLNWSRGDTPAQQFAKLEAVLAPLRMTANAPLFASILGIPPDTLYTPLSESPQIQRAAFVIAIARMVTRSAAGAPLLIFLEDLHWADVTTRELLASLLDTLTDQPAFVVATTRSVDGLTFASDPRVNVIPLAGISSDAAARLATHVSGGRTLPPEIIGQILKQADGNPLFLEELTKNLLESGVIRDEGGTLRLQGRVQDGVIPRTLQDSLMGRLDRVTTAKVLAQTGAAIGREFSLDLLAYVCDQSPDLVNIGMSALEKAEIVFPVPEAEERSWIFKHALIQEAAYESMLKSRRRDLHAKIAEAIENLRPAELTSHPETMAHHLSRAGNPGRAVDFGLAACGGALARSANAEAVAHALACREWTLELPEDAARDKLELRVSALLTPALMQHRGYSAPDVQESAQRALQLLDRYGDSPEAFPNMWGLTIFHHVRSDRQAARTMAERFVTLADQTADKNQLVAGLPHLGQCFWIEGDHHLAESALRRGLALYDIEAHRTHGATYGFDSYSYCQMSMSQVQWITGRADEAMAAAQAALKHAREVKHTNTVGLSLLYVIMLHQQMGDREIVAELVSEALDYCDRMGVSTPTSYIAMIANWARGDVAASQGIYEVHSMVGAELGMTYYRSLGVENAIESGDFAVARAILEDALFQAHSTGERYWLPQLLRLKARIAQATGDGDPLVILSEAADIARESGACVLEALSLLDILVLTSPRIDATLQARLDELIMGHKVTLPAVARKLADTFLQTDA